MSVQNGEGLDEVSSFRAQPRDSDTSTSDEVELSVSRSNLQAALAIENTLIGQDAPPQLLEPPRPQRSVSTGSRTRATSQQQQQTSGASSNNNASNTASSSRSGSLAVPSRSTHSASVVPVAVIASTGSLNSSATPSVTGAAGAAGASDEYDTDSPLYPIKHRYASSSSSPASVGSGAPASNNSSNNNSPLGLGRGTGVIGLGAAGAAGGGVVDDKDWEATAGRRLLEGPVEKSYRNEAFWGTSDKKRTCGERCRANGRSLMTALAYIKAEAQRQPRSYLLGWFTVFLTVFFVTLLIAQVMKSPLIFYRFSEIQTGEQDIIMIPGAGVVESRSLFPSGLPLLNQTFLATSIAANPAARDNVQGVADRWLVPAIMRYNESANPGAPKPIVTNETLNQVSCFALGINSENEAKINLGRTWTRPRVPADGTYLMRTIVYQLGLDPDSVKGLLADLVISPTDILSQVGFASNSSSGSGSTGPTTFSNTTDAKLLLGLLTVLDPANNWPALWPQPLFDPARGPISVSTILNPAPLVTAAFRAAAIPELDNVLKVEFNFTFNQANSLFNQVIAQPLPVLLPNGRNITLNLTGLNPPLPASNATVQALMTRDTPGGDFVLDGPLYDSSFNNALAAAGPSNSTVGEYLGAIAPVFVASLTVQRQLRISDVIVDADGKFAESVGSFALMESDDLFAVIKSTFIQTINGSFVVTVPGPIQIDIAPFINPFLPVPIGPRIVNITDGDTPFSVSVRSLLVASGRTEEAAQLIINGAVAQISAFTPAQATPTVAAMYWNREEAYLSAEKPLSRHMIAFSNSLAKGAGYDYPATFQTPLLIAIKATLVLRYFLDNVFGSVIVFIIFLSALLIYSLLLNDVEAKTYEYGMLRALGMQKANLIQLLLSKSFVFSALGIGTGFLAAYLVGIPITNIIADFAAVRRDYALTVIPIMAGFWLGLVMPLLANVVPISRALSKTLRDSLDVYHHVVSDVFVRVIRLADLGLDLWQTAIAVLMVLVGFVTYYLVPYSFIYNNIPMFLGLLNAILIGMLIGLCVLAQLIQPFVERVFLWLFTRPVHKNLYPLCRKNLAAHRPRNGKTAQMFTIALAFVVFAGVMFALQGKSLADNLRIFQGAPVVIRAPSTSQPLPEKEMTEYLDDLLKRKGTAADTGLTGYTFITYQLRMMPNVRTAFFSNLPYDPEQRQSIYGLQPNFYSAIYTDYYEDVRKNARGPGVNGLFDGGAALLPEEQGGLRIPAPLGSGFVNARLTDRFDGAIEKDLATRRKVINSSYSDYIDVVCSEGLRTIISVDTDTASGIRVRARFDDGTTKYDSTYLAKIRSMAKHVPGFFFSSYPTIATQGAVLVSERQFVRMLNDAFGTEREHVTIAPKERLLLNFYKGVSSARRRDVVNGLRVFFTTDKTMVLDTENTIDSAKFAIDMLNLFFSIVGALAMVLCFVILWLSFTANVQENAWEFGVLRAVGLNSKQVVMIYVYEALSLVFACLVLGTSIGILVAITLTLQFNLFTEVPFTMEFPSMLFSIQVSMAFVVAILASALPAHSFIKRTIAEILRRT